MTAYHNPVLLDEVLAALAVKPNGYYVDGTFGRGGHATAIMQRLDCEGRLLVMDRDPEAVAVAQHTFSHDDRVTVVRACFGAMPEVVANLGWAGKVQGILLDLGVSSPQLDTASRGFSFRAEGPLDMRMDPAVGISAAQWIASASEQEIARVLREYGEEKYVKRIARAIVSAREDAAITTTLQLAGIIAEAVPTRERQKDPATRSFQAIRIFINNELDELKRCLAGVKTLLSIGGRLAVISFHSLEDRMVKRFIRDAERGEVVPAKVPLRNDQIGSGWLRRVGKAQSASESETQLNPRARSATLRVAERIC